MGMIIRMNRKCSMLVICCCLATTVTVVSCFQNGHEGRKDVKTLDDYLKAGREKTKKISEPFDGGAPMKIPYDAIPKTAARKPHLLYSYGRKDLTETNSVSKLVFPNPATMTIKIPHSGFMKGDSMFSLALCVAMVSTLAPPTFIRTIPNIIRAAMIPFWAAGSVFGKRAVIDPYLSKSLTIGPENWCIKRTFLGKSIKKWKGRTSDLIRADMNVAGLVEGYPKHELKICVANKDALSFGLELPDKELESLGKAINDHINMLKV